MSTVILLHLHVLS